MRRHDLALMAPLPLEGRGRGFARAERRVRGLALRGVACGSPPPLTPPLEGEGK